MGQGAKTPNTHVQSDGHNQSNDQQEQRTDNNVNENEQNVYKPWNGMDDQNVTETDLKHDSELHNDVLDEAWEKEHLRYGWGKFRPSCIQVFNTIRWFVFWTCVFSLFQGFIVNGVINAVITTLEKRFDLPSSKSGLIASSNDFLAFFLVLVISYYGGQRNKPRMIGIGILVLGIGSFIFSIPHFATELYNYKGSDLKDFENTCGSNNGTETSCGSEDEKLGSSLKKYLFVFILANALHGAGSTPMYTLGTSFIDENSKAEETPFFLGIIYCLAALGVAGGYMGGGQFLNIYTDADKVEPESIDITPLDPRWVGAWWIPFLISGCMMFIISVPMLGYPKRLPGSTTLQLQRKSEACNTKDEDAVLKQDFGKSWRDFPRAILNLARNPTFLFLSLSACTEGMIISGVATFGAKFLQEKFNLPAALGSFVMGIITVPGAGGGMLLGGFLVKKRKLKCKGIIRMNLIACFLALLFGCVFLLQCPEQSIAGVTKEYVFGSERRDQHHLDHSCNAHCACSADNYQPVCGMDGFIYFSPCLAGCNDDTQMMEGPMGPFKMYNNCSCVAQTLLYKMSLQENTTITTLPSTTTPVEVSTMTSNLNMNTTGPPIGAFQGICMSDCKLLYTVAPLLFIGMLLTFMTCSPTQTATLRCVPGNQRSLAIGFQWLFLRLLGTTPGPLMLGSIMDSACNVWQQLCNGESGSCWIYKKTDMGIRLFVWWVIVKLLSMGFYFAAQYLYKPMDKGDNEDREDEKKLNSDVAELEIRESVI